jgi:hypothetical protein
VYRILSVGSDFHEICDECGFHGGTLDLSAAVARIRALPDRWSEVMSHDEGRLRARPEPDTWCAVEYAQHVVSALGGIEWAARIFAAGYSPDWDELPEDSLPGVFEHDTHECSRFDFADTLEFHGTASDPSRVLWLLLGTRANAFVTTRPRRQARAGRTGGCVSQHRSSSRTHRGRR